MAQAKGLPGHLKPHFIFHTRTEINGYWFVVDRSHHQNPYVLQNWHTGEAGSTRT
jgi:hypothetical protein